MLISFICVCQLRLCEASREMCVKPTRVWALSLPQQSHSRPTVSSSVCAAVTRLMQTCFQKKKGARKVEEEEHLNCSSGLHFDGTSSFTGTVKRPGDRNTGYVVWTQQHRDFTDLKFLLQQPMKGRASKSRRHQERRVVRISE